MKQISNKVFQISLGSVNVFIIDDDGLTLIDTGMQGSADKIFSAIRKEGKILRILKELYLLMRIRIIPEAPPKSVKN